MVLDHSLTRASLHHKGLRTISKAQAPGVKNWEAIADSLSKAGGSWGCVSAIEYVGVPYDAPLGKCDTVPCAASLPFYHPRRENVIRYAQDIFFFFYTLQLCTQPLKFRLSINALFHHSLLHRFYRQAIASP